MMSWWSITKSISKKFTIFSWPACILHHASQIVNRTINSYYNIPNLTIFRIHHLKVFKTTSPTILSKTIMSIPISTGRHPFCYNRVQSHFRWDLRCQTGSGSRTFRIMLHKFSSTLDDSKLSCIFIRCCVRSILRVALDLDRQGIRRIYDSYHSPNQSFDCWIHLFSGSHFHKFWVLMLY